MEEDCEWRWRGRREVGLSDAIEGDFAAYIEARRQLVEDYAELRQARRQWQLVGLIAGTLATIACVGLVVVALRADVVPYVVELDKNQSIVRTYPAEPMQAPSAQFTRATLGRWVAAWRSVSPDTWVIVERMEFVFAVIQSQSGAETRVVGWLRENDPYERAAEETVSVEIISVTKAAGESWQVDWRETVRDRGGREQETNRYAATVQILHGQPKQELILLNPGGLYITNLDWQEVWTGE